MKNPLPSISDSEWVVACAVWDNPGRTAADIAAHLPSTAKWKLKTVNTFLSRLVAKGILDVERDGRAFRYRARIPRNQCVRAESASFVQRVFGGAVAPMIAHFCETEDLTEEEITELRRILNRRTPRKSPNSSGRKK